MILTTLSAIVNKTWLKCCFGYSFSISSLAFLEQEFTEGDYFSNILDAIPSKVAMILGIAYGLVVLLGKISNVYKQHALNMQEIKKGQEKVEQEKIETAEKQKDLEAN